MFKIFFIQIYTYNEATYEKKKKKKIIDFNLINFN